MKGALTMASLIAFFSRRDENYVGGILKVLDIGNTEIAAGVIQKLTSGSVFQIVPQQAYSKDYNACIAEAQEDQRKDARPALQSYPANMDSYDTIYLGYPNYWGTMPMAVFTFLEHYDFTGKTIKPFCTHEGSGLGNSVADIKRLCPTAVVESGIAIRGATAERAIKEIQKWI